MIYNIVNQIFRKILRKNHTTQAKQRREPDEVVQDQEQKVEQELERLRLNGVTVIECKLLTKLLVKPFVKSFVKPFAKPFAKPFFNRYLIPCLCCPTFLGQSALHRGFQNRAALHSSF